MRPKTNYSSFVPRYEALVRGKMEYAVEYREQIYVFETKQKQDKFLRCRPLHKCFVISHVFLYQKV